MDRRRKLPVTTLLMCLDSGRMEGLQKQLSPDSPVGNFGSLMIHQREGMSREEILDIFYERRVYKREKGGWSYPVDLKKMRGTRMSVDLVDVRTGDVVLEAGKEMSAGQARSLEKDGFERALVGEDVLAGLYLACDMVDEETGLVYGEAGGMVDGDFLEILQGRHVDVLEILDIDNVHAGPYILNTLLADKNYNRETALIDVHRILRPGEPPTAESVETVYRNMFFNAETYDLSAVGRVKMNAQLGVSNEDVPDTFGTLRKEDILAIVKRLVDLRDGRGDVDDIDNLGNRRVRAVGELVENQFRMGLVWMERTLRERVSAIEGTDAMPVDLINTKSVSSVIRDFFSSSQLSQFMDQTNPLAEVTHKRRLSAFGPGGLTRERAGFEVRDVHPTHYGRICPVETPEGPNIGLINSLACYAKDDNYGFITTPYRRVKDGVLTDEVVYMSAMEEGNHRIAQAVLTKDSGNRIQDESVLCRRGGDVISCRPDEVDYVDVSPKQVVSVAASLIPFLENDDANRALMGSNMQRQAVPLLCPSAPLVGTGMEGKVARDSRAVMVASRGGIVDQVDANRIVVQSDEDDDESLSRVDIYTLKKFVRSNQNTCIHQRPLVKVGDRLERGDVIADGPSTQHGELALGQNVVVAFMPWNGYNFEDSILVSERLVSDDVYTSVHVEEFEVMARDTKLGEEQITSEIPNLSSESLANLDEAGVVYIGAEVEAGDVLVGKVTPKSESPMTPEEKLLRAIFGEKVSEVKDSSLRLSPGKRGTVVDVRIFNRRGIDKDERSLVIEQEEINRLGRDRDSRLGILRRSLQERLSKKALGATLAKESDGLKVGTVLDSGMIEEMSFTRLKELVVVEEGVNESIEKLFRAYEEEEGRVSAYFNNKVEKLQGGEDLLPGVMKMVKVFVAMRRKLQPGDKMAGRHGNKGVVSAIMPVEDMPFLEDGYPVDIVLNPLGVPSRMNIGQILETHLGWAAKGMGMKIAKMVDSLHKDDGVLLRGYLSSIYGGDARRFGKESFEELGEESVMSIGDGLREGVPLSSPVFDGVPEERINELLEEAGFSRSGQERLIDGRTGEYFDNRVTVGVIYMMRLNHLVDDKIHARSIGPYSLVTQQPLGGKAHFGGQRFGEMEVWALEGYGAAYTLQEILTVKSDDVTGRTNMYESLIRGETSCNPGIPESFNVLVKELRSLGLNVELKKLAVVPPS
jgi:DNA-directed RNA polymerase subunit beta